jgi:hypothetical protein
MGKFIKRFCSVAFGIGAVLFLLPVFAENLSIGSKITSGIIFCFGLFISLAFWGSTIKAVDTSVEGSPGPSPVDTNKADKLCIKQLKKEKRYFPYQKHLAGIPHVKRKARLDILLGDDGIAFFDTAKSDKLYTLPWTSLVSVKTTDSEANKDEATNNTLRMAALTSNKASLSGTIMLEGALALMTKTPLIIKFRLNHDDQYVSSIVFDTFDHEVIAERLNAVRNELINSGTIVIAQRKPIVSADDSFLDKLERLAKLRDAGHLSVAEFEIQKQMLIAK